jgi:hypothetical protein
MKRCFGLNMYFMIEFPSGFRIQKLLVANEEIQADKSYSAAFVTMQGMPQKYGRNREDLSERIIDVMRKYLARHRPFWAELRGTNIAV